LSTTSSVRRERVVGHEIVQRASGLVPESDRVGDGLDDQPGIRQRCQIDESHIALEALATPAGELEGQPRLAAAAGADRREQPGRRFESEERLDVALASDE
jgi:hypothetical protein